MFSAVDFNSLGLMAVHYMVRSNVMEGSAMKGRPLLTFKALRAFAVERQIATARSGGERVKATPDFSHFCDSGRLDGKLKIRFFLARR
jgi:hypothetical protein